MMATEEHEAPEWNQADTESGKLLNGADLAGRLGGSTGTTSSVQRPRGQQKINMCGLFSLEFYRPYFDVNTSQVKSRLVHALWPLRKTASFLPSSDADGGDSESDEPKYPDLYGPVWVSATLIFMLAVVNTLRRGMDQVSSELDKVSMSMYSVLAYLGFGSTGIWAFFRSRSVPLSAAEAISVYGYSLTPFLVGTPLCVFSWPLRWGALAAASTLAMVFVMRSAWSRLEEHTPERSAGVLLAAVAAYHFFWFLFLAAF